jgi:DNA repair/transcription protein MET18/MMS19
LNLLDLVQGLEPLLTSVEPFDRVKGVQALTRVLEVIPSSLLSTPTTSVLLKFYVEKLYDQPSVPDLLRGLLALLIHGKEGDSSALVDDVLMVPKVIFAELNLQSFQHGVRNSCLKIFRVLLSTRIYLDSLKKKFGPEFIFNYIALTENEKDPRNLVVAFSNIALICKGFEDSVIETYAEDLFDNFFCYFPVTFNQTAASQKDPNAITSDDLKQGLRYSAILTPSSCMSASPRFSKFALPMLVEKLSSALPNSKIDSMQAISDVCQVYPISEIAQHSLDIWQHLKEACEEMALVISVISSNDTDLFSARSSAIQGVYEMLQTSDLLAGQEVRRRD